MLQKWPPTTVPSNKDEFMNPKVKTGGVVLCGGKSTRMGTSKAWLQFGNEAMLQRIVRILQQVVEPIVVVKAPEQDIPELPPNVHIVEDFQPGLGPLAGIQCGLTKLNELDTPCSFVTACDAPFLNTDLVRRLTNMVANDSEIVLLDEGKFQHILCAAYRSSVGQTAKKLIAANRMRPIFLTEEHPTRFIPIESIRDIDPNLDSLKNLNTKEDYERALTLLAELES